MYLLISCGWYQDEDYTEIMASKLNFFFYTSIYLTRSSSVVFILCEDEANAESKVSSHVGSFIKQTSGLSAAQQFIHDLLNSHFPNGKSDFAEKREVEPVPVMHVISGFDLDICLSETTPLHWANLVPLPQTLVAARRISREQAAGCIASVLSAASASSVLFFHSCHLFLFSWGRRCLFGHSVLPTWRVSSDSSTTGCSGCSGKDTRDFLRQATEGTVRQG